MKVRNKGIDQVKAYATLMVILSHALNDNYMIKNYLGINKSSRLFNTVLNVISSTGVPLFLIATGYFLYDREKEYEEIFFKKILPLWIHYTFWVVINRPLNSYSIRGDLSAILKEIFLMKTPWPQYLWYIPAIFGIFLMSPLLQKMLVSLNKKDFKYLFIIVLGVTSFDYYNLISNIYKLPKLSLNIGISVSTVMLFLYTMYGYYFKNFSEKEQKSRKEKSSLLVIFIVLGVMQFNLLNNRIGHRVYNYPLGILFSLLTFKVVYFLKLPHILDPYLRFVSENSLTYYLMHRFILYNLNKKIYFINRPLNSIFAFVTTVIVVTLLIFVYKTTQEIIKNILRY